MARADARFLLELDKLQTTGAEKEKDESMISSSANQEDYPKGSSVLEGSSKW